METCERTPAKIQPRPCRLFYPSGSGAVARHIFRLPGLAVFPPSSPLDNSPGILGFPVGRRRARAATFGRHNASTITKHYRYFATPAGGQERGRRSYVLRGVVYRGYVHNMAICRTKGLKREALSLSFPPPHRFYFGAGVTDISAIRIAAHR